MVAKILECTPYGFPENFIQKVSDFKIEIAHVLMVELQSMKRKCKWLIHLYTLPLL